MNFLKTLFFCLLCSTSLVAQNMEFTSCDDLFHLEIDWLYWKAQQDNMAVASFVNLISESPTIVESKNVRPPFKYDNGFRFNLNYTPLCSDWQLSAIYTYIPFKSDTFNEIGDPPTVFFSSNPTSFPILTSVGLLNSLSTKWSGNLSYLDIDFARTISFMDCFQLRPHIGFRGAWMSQTLSLEGDPQAAEVSLLQVKMKEKLQAYGLQGGFWGDWSMGNNFSVIGHIGGSVLYSNFKLEQNSLGFLDDDLVADISGGDKPHTTTPTMDYLVGLQYKTSIKGASVMARIVWEQHVFFELNQIAFGGGNFSAQGLTAGLTFNF